VGRLTGMPNRLGGLAPKVSAMPKVAESFYQSPGWLQYRREHRAWTIAQQGGVWCCECGSTHRLILDHEVERKDGGPDLPPFDQAKWYCGRHHSIKTAKARARRARGGG